jgi:hypothetical protein
MAANSTQAIVLVHTENYLALGGSLNKYMSRLKCMTKDICFSNDGMWRNTPPKSAENLRRKL